MQTHIFSSLKITLASVFVFAVLYTLLVWGAAQFAPAQGQTQFIERNGQRVGATLIGQSFTDDRYFWGRPPAVGYNAAGSGGSNKGPTNPDYLAQVQARIDTFLVHNPGVTVAQIPSDLVTASGSGLDPHISPQAAQVQVARVARTRGIDVARVADLVKKYTETPLWGLFGTARVNVLRLNLELVDKG